MSDDFVARRSQQMNVERPDAVDIIKQHMAALRQDPEHMAGAQRFATQVQSEMTPSERKAMMKRRSR